MKDQTANSSQQKKCLEKCEEELKWRRLEEKYKQYIHLLKKKLLKVKQQLEMKSKQSTTAEGTCMKGQPQMKKLFQILENLRTKHLWTALSKIIDQGKNCQSKKYYNAIIKIMENKVNIAHKNKFFDKLKLFKERRDYRKQKMNLLINRVSKLVSNKKIYKFAFQSIKEYCYHSSVQPLNRIRNIFEKVQSKIKLNSYISFNMVKLHAFQFQFQNTQKEIQYNLLRLKSLLSFFNLPLEYINKKDKYSQIFIQNCKLKMQITDLNSSLESLKKQLANTIEKREKDNIKKSEGLEQLAEELREKDQLICEYENELEIQRLIKSSKILTLSAIQYQIQKRRLQKINNKLNEENTFKQLLFNNEKQKLQKQIYKLKKSLQQEYVERQRLQRENEELKQYRFEKEYEKEEFTIERQNLLRLQSNLQKREQQYIKKIFAINKLKSENKQIKFLEEEEKEYKQTASSFNVENLTYNFEEFKVISIIQRLILGQLNIKIESEFQNPNLVKRLNQIKEKIKELKQIKASHKNTIVRIPASNKEISAKQCLDEVLVMKNNDTQMQSVYQFFKPHEVNQFDQLFHNLTYKKGEKIEENSKINEMKLIIEGITFDKNKKQEQIFELKQKLMHIRMIMLKFCRSLQLNAKISKQTKEILILIFNLFEYSEDEKNQVFPEKKKSTLFNFFS